MRRSPNRPPKSVHNLYQRVLEETERAALEHAARMSGLDDEIALLRAKLATSLEAGGLAALPLDVLHELVNAVKAQHRLSAGDANALMDAVAGILETFAPDDG